MAFAEYEACVAAGLDLWKWENNEYSIPFKAKVVAWHNLSRLIDVHTEAAKADAAEKKSKSR